MTEYENNIRKAWLWLLMILSTESFFQFFDLLELANGDQVRSKEVILFGFGGVIARFFFDILKYYIVYRCAYKKPGTKYLTFCLIVGPITLIREIYTQFQQALTDFNPVIFAVGAVYVVALVAWYIVGWKLRSINRQYQLRTAQ